MTAVRAPDVMSPDSGIRRAAGSALFGRPGQTGAAGSGVRTGYAGGTSNRGNHSSSSSSHRLAGGGGQVSAALKLSSSSSSSSSAAASTSSASSLFSPSLSSTSLSPASVSLSSAVATSSMSLLATVQRLVNSIPLPDLTYFRHIVVISFIQRNSQQTNIHIEIREMEGGVRATSILCLLGIGLGLGSVLLYKLCCRVFAPAVEAPKDKKSARQGALRPGDQTEATPDVNSPETPDSGISTTTPMSFQMSAKSSVAATPESPHGLRHRGSHPYVDSDDYLYQESAAARRRSHTVDSPRHLGSGDHLFSPATCCLSPHRGLGSPVGRGRSTQEAAAASGGGGGLCPQLLLSSALSTDQGFVSQSLGPSSLPGASREHLGLSQLVSDTDSLGGRSLPPDFSPARFAAAPAPVSARLPHPERPGVLEAGYVTDAPGNDHSVSDYANFANNQGLFNSTPQGSCEMCMDCSVCPHSHPPSHHPHAHPHHPPPHQQQQQQQHPWHKQPSQWYERPLATSDEDVLRELNECYERRPFRRHQTYSVASDLSSATDFSARESLFSKGYSIDLGESLQSRITTPVSVGLLEPEFDLESTTSNMDQIHQELRQIREEIGEMNSRVQTLNSRENLMEILTLAPNLVTADDPDVVFSPVKVSRRPRTRRDERPEGSLAGSRSTSASVERDLDDPATPWRRSFHYEGEFMWDYQSDLATSEHGTNFVARRPLITGDAHAHADRPRNARHGNTGSHDNKRELDSPGSSVSLGEESKRRKMTRSRTLNSIQDMYIEDELVRELGADLAPEGRRHLPEGISCTEERHRSVTPSGEYKPRLSDADVFIVDNKNNNVGVGEDNRAGVRWQSPVKTVASPGEDDVCHDCGSPSHRRHHHSGGGGGGECGTRANNNQEVGTLQSLSPGSPLARTHSRTDPALAPATPPPCNNCGYHDGADSPLTRGRPPMLRHALSGAGSRRKWEVRNVSRRVNIYEYAEREWTADSGRAQTMKKGYHQVQSLLGLSQLRPVRADNYCALRATLYQIIVHRLPVLEHLGSLDHVVKKLQVFHSSKYAFLQSWNFANRLPFTPDTLMDRLQDCLAAFYQQVEECTQYGSAADREEHLLHVLNFDPEVDLQMMEAVKLLMTLKAIDLHADYVEGHGTPVFVWLMFARETSLGLEALFRNHINPLGDISGTEQLELFLLGHTLGVKMEVVRPARYGQEDFISHYPDEGADNFPKIFLVAEDDRHYHVILP